jgi:hypothetical protein
MNRITSLVLGRMQAVPSAAFSLITLAILAHAPGGSQGAPLVIEAEIAIEEFVSSPPRMDLYDV